MQHGDRSLEAFCIANCTPHIACDRAASISHTVAEKGNLVLPPLNTLLTAPISDPMIAAAAAASAQAKIDVLQLCFCYCDLPEMELVILKCCKQTVHWQCVLAYLGINSQWQWAYCQGSVIDIAGVLDLPTINRLEIISAAMSPTPRKPAVKWNLQLLFMYKTLFGWPTCFGQYHRKISVRANVIRPKT